MSSYHVVKKAQMCMYVYPILIKYITAVIKHCIGNE